MLNVFIYKIPTRCQLLECEHKVTIEHTVTPPNFEPWRCATGSFKGEVQSCEYFSAIVRV